MKKLLLTLFIGSFITTSVFGAADGVVKSDSSSGKDKSSVKWVDVNETNASGNVYLTKEQIENMTLSGEIVSDVNEKNPTATEKTDADTENNDEKETTPSVATPSPSVTTPSSSAGRDSISSAKSSGITVKVPIGENAIYVNNQKVSTDAAAYIQTRTSSTMIPLRFVSVALSGETDALNSDMVSWDANTKTVTIFTSKLIRFEAGSNTVFIDGSYKTINGGIPEITNGRMYVPFRALGEAIGCNVSWDAVNKVAIFEM